MAGRIITLQRQARELGRLRMGWSEPYTDKYGREKRKPIKSTKWVFTTPQRAYLDAAVEAWGGEVEHWQPQGNGAKVWRVITEADAIDAILPPGDPLSQSYEIWSKGGAQRRCDGETDQLSCKACPCRAEFGDEFYLQPPDKTCRPHSRLNVVLPDMPDLGVWRVETKGYYAANEIAAAVDLILHATGGKVAVPIRLRIEPRTRVAEGKTKQFLVLAMETRGATAGQILAGQMATIALDGGGQHAVNGAPQRQALEAGAAPAEEKSAREKLTPNQVIALAKLTKNLPQLQGLWKDAVKAEAMNDEVKAVLEARAKALSPKPAASVGEARPAPAAAPVQSAADQEPTAPPAEEVAVGEVEPDTDTLWMQILKAAGDRKWNSDGLEQRVTARFNKASDEINGWQMATLLDEIKSGAIA
jgi:hypothetical protein